MLDCTNRAARLAGVRSTASAVVVAFWMRSSSSAKKSFQDFSRSSEVTRKPRSMKKFSVVCHAGPRSRSVPRPRPSRFQRNSFRPLETRVVWTPRGGRLVPVVATGGAEPRCPALWPEGAAGDTLRLALPPAPIPSLFKNPIKLDYRRPRRGVRGPGLGLVRLRGPVGLRLSANSRFSGFDLAAQYRAIFNGQPLSAD